MLIESSEMVYLSIASLWEIAIKVSLGKLSLNMPYMEFVERHIDGNNFTLLGIRPTHLAIIATLPFHHRDPFDRLIIAQYLGEKLSLIGKDSAFDAYTELMRDW